jgi:hypothetical protein
LARRCGTSECCCCRQVMPHQRRQSSKATPPGGVSLKGGTFEVPPYAPTEKQHVAAAMRRDAAAGSDAKPCIVASMAKKTTTPAGSKLAKPKTVALSERRKLDEEIRKLEERQGRRAVDRAIRWARLLDQLETLLDRADDLFTHGVPVDFDSVARVHAEMHAASDDPANRPTLGDVYKMESDAETYFLARDLQLAENWIPTILRVDQNGDLLYQNGHSRAISDVRLRLEGKAPFDASSTPAEAIALGITCVRTLLAYDLRRAKSFDRAPSEEDLDVLQRLRDKPKTAKELAVEIAGKSKPYKTEEKRVTRTIERLKHVHGFELPNERGSGYTLSPRDHARLDAIDRGT